jgi:EAL domain-containing protein (putative c-di-GMP-specific phosphodiesterase class I)
MDGDLWPRDPFEFVIASRDREIDTLVADAIAGDRAQLAFQPIVTSAEQPKIAFYEGLIRLRDGAGRILPAGSFIATVEEKALGREIDCASLRLGLALLARHPRVLVSINMSARSIGDGKWRRTLEAGLLKSPDLGRRLILEMSEGSAMLLPEVVIRFMAEVRPRGVRFALDDFGAGLIAFRHLRDFQFDIAKVDSLFVRGIDASPDNQVLAAALVKVARQLGMLVVAEGVETQEEARYMRKLGVEYLQGYLFGVPKAAI